VVALHAAVHDGGVALLGDALLGDLGVNPVREAPHVGTDLAKLDGTRGIVRYGVLEGLAEVAIVEEDVGVVVPAVEVALDRLDGLDDAVQLRVTREDDECGIGARLARVGLEAAGDEDLVVFFADFPAGRDGSVKVVEDRIEVAFWLGTRT